MTDTNQLPPLPTLRAGDSHMESIIDAAIQGHASTREAMRWLVRQLVPATQPAEVRDEREAFEQWYAALPNNGRKAGLTLLDAWQARTILALRPERVPMTKDAVERAAMYWAPEYRAALKAGIASAEAHHGITAQAKKETP